jgi:hypothetical protein
VLSFAFQQYIEDIKNKELPDLEQIAQHLNFPDDL